MRKFLILFFSLFVVVSNSSKAGTTPNLSVGQIKHLENFQSKFVAPHNIDIWLPKNYSKKKHYNVLYMHDGQALFDDSPCFKPKSWKVDETLGALLSEGKIVDTIVVGIWYVEDYRDSEYYPQKYLDFVDQVPRDKFVNNFLQGKPQSDNYLKFLVTEVKPYIDKNFSTLPDRDHTFIMGSSMGGMVSLYAISEYPDVFGAAAALSTHWVGIREPNMEFPLAAFTYLQDHLPDSATHRIYMDRGTKKYDSFYPPHQTYADELFRLKGYNDKNFMTKVFEGASHNEVDWAKRLDIPLVFLLGKNN